MRPRIRLLIGDAAAPGPGKASLLEAIDDTGVCGKSTIDAHI